MVTVPPNRDEDLAARLASLAEALVTSQQSGLSDEESLITKNLQDLIPRALASGDPSISEIVVYIVPLLPKDAAQAIFNSFRESRDGQTQLRALEMAAYAFEPEVRVDVIQKMYAGDLVARMPAEFRSSAEQLQNLLLGQRASLTSALPPTTKLTSITTVIHGTFAAHGTWWRPGSPFMNGVASKVQDLYTTRDYFHWSGANSDRDRRQAAQDLLSWVNQRLVPSGKLRLICHSHGGNVAMIASQLGLKIANLIFLGTPIRTDYTPNMKNITNVHNIYAPWDTIQSLGTLPLRRGEGRTLADTESTLNIAERTGRGGPLKSHSALCDWQVWTHTDNKFDIYLV